MIGLATLAAVTLGAGYASAEDGSVAVTEAAPIEATPQAHVVVLPIVILADDPDAELSDLASDLDALLSDTAQDLGLSVDLGDGAASDVTEGDLTERATEATVRVFRTTLERAGRVFELRMTMAQPGTPVLRVRMERASRREAAVRAAVMLRDLVEEEAPREVASSATGQPRRTPEQEEARSQGRVVLAANATLYGGLFGLSMQRASGSDDPRLLYPLLAVGAGIGLGGSLLASEEWDVGTGDAWYLSAGAWWPTLAGHLIYQGRFAPNRSNTDERWTFGLVGGATGVTLSVLSLAMRGPSEGAAALAHSGGGLGLMFGGLLEAGLRGDVHQTPFSGMGYGAGVGWLVAAAVAPYVHLRASRVLTIDLGAVLGGLGGAALASPLLFSEPTEAKQRGWVGATAGASLLGVGTAWFLTRDTKARAAKSEALVHTRFVEAGAPTIGIIGESLTASGSVPAIGVSWSGRLYY